MPLKTDRRLIPTAAHWGTYFAEVENGNARRLTTTFKLYVYDTFTVE